jgi:hypothetical protein
LKEFLFLLLQPLLFLLFLLLPKRVKNWPFCSLSLLPLGALAKVSLLLSLVFVFIFALLLPRFAPQRATCSKEKGIKNKGIKSTKS